MNYFNMTEDDNMTALDSMQNKQDMVDKKK